MDTIKAIKTRRSIRKFSEDRIPQEMLHKIVECGMYAPSAGNEQPWHFIIITNPEILRSLPSIHKHARMFSEATAGILVCFQEDLEMHKEMAIQDCAAATQNMLLAIHTYGYGACWCGVYPREERMNGLSELFNLPKGVIPFSLIAIGLPNEEKELVNRYLSDRIHLNEW